MLTQEQLKLLLTYDPETGIFKWIKSKGVARSGREAGTIKLNYIKIMIDRKGYFAHRLAWLYIYGKWPSKEIDHINRNGLDNRISNLREADASQNRQNRGMHKCNTSGYKGVSYHIRRKKWRAAIGVDGGLLNLGHFDTPERAHIAYKIAAYFMYGEFRNY